MVIIDIVMLVLITLAVVRGAKTGGINQLLSLAGIVVAFLLAAPLSGLVSRALIENTNIADEFIPILSFLVIFGLIQIGAYFLAELIEALLDAVKLGVIDKFLGGFVGAVKAILLIGLVLFAVRFVGIPGKEAREASLFYDTYL